MSRNRSKIFDEIFLLLFFLFHSILSISSSRESFRIFLLKDFSKTSSIFLDRSSSIALKSPLNCTRIRVTALSLFISSISPRSHTRNAIGILHASITTSIHSTMMFKNSCYVFHTVSFDPRRNGAPRKFFEANFQTAHHSELVSYYTLLHGQKRVVPSSRFLANSSRRLFESIFECATRYLLLK